jgi:hypothetical protein
MANTASTPGIVNNWSLIAFARSHGKMQVGQFTNSETGETFKSCIFTDPKDSANRTFVAFSSKLGELTPREIAAQASELQVVELASGTFKLCHTGSDAWEDVDLAL